MGTAMGSSEIEMSGQRSAQDFAGRVVIVTGAWRGLGRGRGGAFPRTRRGGGGECA